MGSKARSSTADGAIPAPFAFDDLRFQAHDHGLATGSDAWCDAAIVLEVLGLALDRSLADSKVIRELARLANTWKRAEFGVDTIQRPETTARGADFDRRERVAAAVERVFRKGVRHQAEYEQVATNFLVEIERQFPALVHDYSTRPGMPPRPKEEARLGAWWPKFRAPFVQRLIRLDLDGDAEANAEASVRAMLKVLGLPRRQADNWLKHRDRPKKSSR